MRRVVASVSALLVALALGAAGPAEAKVRASTITMQVDGSHRRFAVAGPPSDMRPRGIFVALHGGGRHRTGREFARDVGLFDRASARGWVVVAPDALGGQFHAGDCCGSRDKQGRTDDLRFISSAVRYARKRFRATRGPVVATGFSTGGFMAYRLACQTRLVSAIAVVAGLEVTGEPCLPRRPVSVLQVQALDDGRVPYDGRFGLGGLGERRGVLALTQFWARRGGCARPVSSDEGEVRTRRAVGCRRGIRVASVTTRTGGHAWSGAGPVYGPGSPALDVTATVLDFLAR